MKLPSGYKIRRGCALDKALLLKFMQQTYSEMFAGQNISHLQQTVEQYFSHDTPLWCLELVGVSKPEVVGCLWAGNAIDQIHGDRHAHVFLLYVVPEHRRKGLATALMQHLETWAKQRGDRQLGLQVFTTSTPAINLYEKFGYQTQSLWMIKSL